MCGLGHVRFRARAEEAQGFGVGSNDSRQVWNVYTEVESKLQAECGSLDSSSQESGARGS